MINQSSILPSCGHESSVFKNKHLNLPSEVGWADVGRIRSNFESLGIPIKELKDTAEDRLVWTSWRGWSLI